MKKLIIANWKMELSHDQACSWLESDLPDVQKTLSETPHSLVICPSYTVIPYAISLYPDNLWGAQDCGFKERGPYTGDVSVLSLNDLSLAYCLVGHSERRRFHGETDKRVAQKVELLLKHTITPVVCIGETAEQKNQRSEVLKKQLSTALPLYAQYQAQPVIAYEPVWSIGTGIIPSSDELKAAVIVIKELCDPLKPLILYGGSVEEKTVQEFSSLVDGFLIGSASLDPGRLKKIIISC